MRRIDSLVVTSITASVWTSDPVTMFPAHKRTYTFQRSRFGTPVRFISSLDSASTPTFVFYELRIHFILFNSKKGKNNLNLITILLKVEV
jgi:hypothetical protein